MSVSVATNYGSPRWWRSRWLIPGALLALAMTVYLTPSFAQAVDPATQELLRQQERGPVLREQREPTPDVRSPPAAQAGRMAMASISTARTTSPTTAR